MVSAWWATMDHERLMAALAETSGNRLAYNLVTGTS